MCLQCPKWKIVLISRTKNGYFRAPIPKQRSPRLDFQGSTRHHRCGQKLYTLSGLMFMRCHTWFPIDDFSNWTWLTIRNNLMCWTLRRTTICIGERYSNIWALGWLFDSQAAFFWFPGQFSLQLPEYRGSSGVHSLTAWVLKRWWMQANDLRHFIACRSEHE